MASSSKLPGQARPLGLGAPVFGGGRWSDSGRDDAHASTSLVSHATLFAVSLRGLGNVPLATRLWIDDFDSDRVSATCCNPSMMGCAIATVFGGCFIVLLMVNDVWLMLS